VVGFPAGTTIDNAARAIAGEAAKTLGQPIVVENRAGAGGAIATDHVAKSTDGHTFLVGTVGPLFINPLAGVKQTFDPDKDLTPVAMLGRSPQLLVVNAKQAVTTFQDFVAAAKRPRANFSYGTTGVGSQQHIFLESLNRKLDLNMEHIPYRGGPQAVQDLLAGRLQLMSTPAGNAMGPIADGTMRALAILAPQRMGALPNVPTATEIGVPELAMEGWALLVAPRATPDAVLRQINTAVAQAQTVPAVTAVLERDVYPAWTMTLEEVRAFMPAEQARWATLIKLGDIKITE
jgi:tripartite-type tricarboxylate transporter receptor subunit TctC